MANSELSLSNWVNLSDSRQETVARVLGQRLPPGFQFLEIDSFELGSQRHRVAIFEFQGCRFVLVPGGDVKLGFDVGAQFHPTAEQIASFRETATEYGIEKEIEKSVSEACTSPRQTCVLPLLVETEAREVGLQPLALDQPDLQSIIRSGMRKPTERKYELHRGDTITRVTRDERGNFAAFRIVSSSHDELAASLAREGFRLPTSDEWEHLCGGGAQTLFRWGDDCPCDRYPTDVSLAEAQWRRRWVQSRGTLEPPPQPWQWEWDVHRRPNAFGLKIAFDTYLWELVAEPGLRRGGDGGTSVCGGYGFFAGWLPLATAFIDPNLSDSEDLEEDVRGAYARRVLSIE